MFLNFFVQNILCFSFPFVYGAKYEPHLLWELPKSSCLLLIFSLTKDFNIFFYYRGLRVDQTRDHWSRASLMFPIKASIVIGQQIQLNLKQLWLLQHQHEKSNSKRVINPKKCVHKKVQPKPDAGHWNLHSVPLECDNCNWFDLKGFKAQQWLQIKQGQSRDALKGCSAKTHSVMSLSLCLEISSIRGRVSRMVGASVQDIRGSSFCVQECICVVESLATVVCLITREFQQCCLNISWEGGWGDGHNAGSV